MKRIHVRRLATAALAFLWLGLSPAPAEVKLRIYMQDGSLQAGNLINETNDAFVVLGKDGRVEIPKKNIMFINGKTLKQWNERPDKLFQTEIMPSDVPDPAFVNNKASLPPVPKLPAPAAAAAAPAAPATPTPPVVLAPVEPLAPVAPPPAVVKAKPAAEPHAVAAKAAPRSHHKTKVAAVAAPGKPAVAAAPAAPAEESPVEEHRPNNRRLADRAAKGAAHRERGMALLAQGHRAQAMQELMIARLLEPNNGTANLVLAQIDRAEGLTSDALRYLDHWTLRKSDVAAREVTEINREIESRARRLFYMEIGVGAGAFAWLPALLVYRRFRRRRRAAAPVEADVEETVVEAPRAPDWVRQTEARFAEGVPVPAAPPPAPVMAPPPPVKIALPPPPPAPMPVAPPAFEIVREEEILAEEPPASPVEEISAAPAAEPVAAETPEPVYEETPAEIPAPEPVYEPVAASADFDPHEILAMARSVENSLVRANAAAAAGRMDESRRSYRTALALNADCASAHLGLGYLAFCEQKWDTSLLHYRKALEIDPGSADAHYGAARVLLEINRIDDAVPELRATLTLDPTYDDARDALTAIGKPA